MICQRIEDCKGAVKTQLRETFSERGASRTEYKVYNPNQTEYHKIDFENCVYADRPNDTKCDFGLLTNNSMIYIELKGKDVRKGLKQLKATIEETNRCFGNREKKARLIVTGSPSIEALYRMPEYVRLAKSIGATRSNKNLEIKKEFTETI